MNIVSDGCQKLIITGPVTMRPRGIRQGRDLSATRGGGYERHMDITKYNSYRKCKECKIEKPLRAFPSKVCKANGKRYFQYRCNKCQYVLWKEKNADKVDKYYKAQRHREFYIIEGRASMLRNRCKCRARKYNHEFNLSKEKIITMLELGFCQ